MTHWVQSYRRKLVAENFFDEETEHKAKGEASHLANTMSTGADIRGDVLQEIFERIPLHADIVRCAAVCKQWRSIVLDNLHRVPENFPLCYCLPQQHPLPLLMQCDDDENVGNINFFSVLDNKSFTDLVMPEISGNWIAGSSSGCLVLNEVLSQKVHLLNPLTRAHMSLPSFGRQEFCRGSFGHALNKVAYIRRALVLSEPNARNLDGCTVIAIVSRWSLLSFCRAGDDRWTNINEGSPLFVDDVIYFKGQLYAVEDRGALISFDLEQQEGGVAFVAGHVIGDRKRGKRYLVESTYGDLLLVLRSLADDGSYLTSTFSVFKLEEVDEARDGVIEALYIDRNCDKVERAVKYKWAKLESLDDQILFVGRNCSKSVPASLHPHLKGNCIYFTDDDLYDRHILVTRARAGDELCDGHYDNKEVKYDMGIYDVEEESIRPIGSMDDGKQFRVPPVWVEPNLCFK